ncbi:MAG: alanine/ornithine racemase family PLP-dependent enzyme [Bacillota bacterium]|nr:alanine/ornithine racemase family PLP-dependent enzyme [Bacillota bacterium]
MERYPILEVNVNKIYNNAKVVTGLCKENNIKVAGIIKGFGGIVPCADAMVKGGCVQIGSSRIEQLKQIKKAEIDIPLMLIRIPMKNEIKDVVKYSDICLVSERNTLSELQKQAKKQNKLYKIILMYDLGDLREGVFSKDELLELALYTELELSNLILEGIGTNLTCYGSIAPTYENLKELSDVAEFVEQRIGRKLEIISGGGTTTLPTLLQGFVPEKINHLRIGEGIINTQDLPLYWNSNIDGLDADTFILKAQIVELNKKPTHPIGKIVVNAFGETSFYEDKGIRKRAIVALGNQDVGDSSKLIPKDKSINVLGASSDHTILDIEDCEKDYKLGDIIEFNVLYPAMLFSSLSEYVHKKIIK